ncbi:MAG: (d)CMP kinase [Chthonomonadales bacterium]
MNRLTIAIDGPSGAGKSTVARMLASELNFTYIDTGAMYRAVAWASLRDGIALKDIEGQADLASRIKITFTPKAEGGQLVFVDGTDVTDAIRLPEVTQLSSPVSAITGVRKVLVDAQQNMGKAGGVVMEGRDIGTVVFPNAEVKVFLTASAEERARRRLMELQSKGSSLTFEDILAQQQERDHRDSTREESPLRPADDALEILSDGLTAKDVVKMIVKLCEDKSGK